MSTAQAQQKLSLSQAARVVGIAAQSFNDLANKGAILYTLDEVTGWRVYDRAEVERLAEERAAKRRKSA